tara:strand:- start:620 stop:1174 length:555 start_codon:yes stop_codon:yes gene_type:complete
MEILNQLISDLEKQMKDSLDYLSISFSKIRAGKASVKILDGIKIDYYGTQTPLSQASNISTPDSSTIKIQPWDKSILDLIQKEIISSNLGLNPVKNEDSLIINIPTLTEERRKELVKQAKFENENTKISIRNIRRKGNDDLKKHSDFSKDLISDFENKIQKLTDLYISKSDDLFKIKESDIMTV